MKRGRDTFIKFRFFFRVSVFLIKIFPKRIRIRLFYMLRNLKGIIGIGVRYILIKSIAIRCGDNVSIHSCVFILNPENMLIGNNVSIHPLCYLDAAGKIEIGDDVSIAHNVTIMSTSHNYNDGHIPIKDQGVIKKKTIISNNVWIGAKAVLLYGVEISQRTVIACSTVVNKSTVANSVYAGVPAKLIKEI